ncbi:MAG: AAA family ATPase [Oligoflexia bacterium]|nr:AAA family ATPase [Oligoflexia bacterium]
MINSTKLFFTQAQMSVLSRMNKSTISRFISTNKYNCLPLDCGTNRYSLEDTRQIVRNFIGKDKFRRGETQKKKIFTFYNFKGGVGKSVLSSQVALHLAIMGFNVLAIDLDPQSHLTLNCGIRNWAGKTMYDVMIEGCELDEVICKAFDGLDIIPANLGLTKLELPLVQKNQREMVLSKVLKAIVDSYDYIIIDTNPTISVLNINSLVAANQILIPCSTQPLAYNGLALVFDGLRDLFDDLERSVEMKIIPNMYDVKTITSQEVLGALRSEYGNFTVSTVIHKCEDVNISSKTGAPLISFAKKNSPALEDMISLIHEMISMSEGELKSSDAIDLHGHTAIERDDGHCLVLN